MRRRALRIIAASLILFVIVDIGSCQLHDALVSPVVADGLIRQEVLAPNGYTLSYLANIESTAILPRLVYVHGTPGDATAFERYLLDPIPGFESLSIDRPGFGLTVPRTLALTLAEQAKALEPLLLNREERGTILVGHSLGGPIIVQAALDYPERVAGLVILAGSLDPALESVAWYQHLAEFAFVPYMIPGDLRRTNREVIPLKDELEALRPRLKDLQCPIVIVHAPDDMLVSAANVDYMLAEFPKDRVIEVMRPEGKNHFVPWNAEADVRRAIQRVADAAAKP